MQRFHSNGKLLLTGEYVVLDGAKALAIPTKLGQNLIVEDNGNNNLQWQSFLQNGDLWFEMALEIHNNTFHSKVSTPYSKRLIQVLNAAASLNSGFIAKAIGKTVTTHLEFANNWGLGSSSTLLNNVANWADVNVFNLSEKTFGGSGYDVAVAQQKTSILYQRVQNSPKIKRIDFRPSFSADLFFVYLNQKQNSRASINHYKQVNKVDLIQKIKHISEITTAVLDCDNIALFEELIHKHEAYISEVISTPTIKSQLFKDYPKAIKSLGGWGGDFILAVGREEEHNYFRNLGYNTIISYDDMVLK